jgi:hypothetical protein
MAIQERFDRLRFTLANLDEKFRGCLAFRPNRL